MENVLIYPESMSVFSYYAFLIGLLTIFVLRHYGLEIFKNTWNNYTKYRLLNMETLITLGSLSATIMLVYLIIIYSLEDISELMPHERNHEKMMRVTMFLHMMETATLIICIVNIGKYLEGKAKKSIIKMTEDIFPEDSIEGNSHMNYIEPKNRRFLIEREKEYEISLFDKEDIVRIKAPMKLLVDGIVVFTSPEQPLKLTDSVCYGWDEKFTPKIGERIRSGADIVEGEGYLQIETPIEQCMLSKISNQLNMAQNESEQQESGLSALFSKLSKNFVLGVILVAVTTLLTWALMIFTDYY
jgi:P-type Cu+ transporter